MKLEEIKKLIEAATPGPWHSDYARPDGYVTDQKVVRASKPVNATTDVLAVCNPCAPNDAFIAASRTLMPKLLKVAEAFNRFERRLKPIEKRVLGEDAIEDLGEVREALAGLT